MNKSTQNNNNMLFYGFFQVAYTKERFTGTNELRSAMQTFK